MLAHLEHIASTQFGIPFLKELVKKKSLNYEKAKVYYLKEVRAALKEGLAKRVSEKKDGKTVKRLVYDFEQLFQRLVEELEIKEPEYLDSDRLAKIFERLVMKAKKTHLFERILLGRPLIVH